MPETIYDLPLDQIAPNPAQPRKLFDATGLQELAASIQANGLAQPICVAPRDLPGGAEYIIVAGERRWRACRLAGLTEIPAIIRDDLDDSGVAEIALIENLNRRDLTLMEEARAYQGFLDNGYTLERLAALLGFKQPHRITERTRLLRLDAKFQDALERGIINPSQAYEMSRLSAEGQYQVWRAIQNGACETYSKLRRLVAAIEMAERQQDLFKRSITEKDRAALSKVDAFVREAGRLLGLITEDDLSVIETVKKSDAPSCIAKLDLLMKVSRQVRDALEANLAKQRVEEGLAA